MLWGKFENIEMRNSIAQALEVLFYIHFVYLFISITDLSFDSVQLWYYFILFIY